jgi:peptidoglycan/LPS O-acetylase OafA/YrhL
MTSLVIWMITLTIGICSIILSAASGMPEIYMAMTALISIVIAFLAIKDQRDLESSGASESVISASTARHMGLVWTWGALALLVTYYFILPSWREWPHFFAGLAIVGVLCLFFASTLSGDSEKGTDDATMLKLGRYLTIAQLAGTGVAVAGLLIDPDKQFLNVSRPDWAATNVFFFGALALAAISAHALLYGRSR